MHGPTTRRPIRRHSRRVPRGVAVILTTLSLIGVNLSGLDVATTPSAAATPTVSSLTLPTAGLNPAANAATHVSAQSISCASTTFCVASGDYSIATLSGGYDGFIATGTYSAGIWNWAMTTLPTSGLSPAVASYPITDPNIISCPSSSTCVTAGSYIDNANSYDGFFATGTLSAGGWSWSLQTMPTSGLSPTQSSPSQVYPQGISCPTTSSCLATGYYVDNGNRSDAFVVAGVASAGTWSWTPQNLSASSTTLTNGTLATRVLPTAISCPSATSCLATGTYNPSGYTFSFYVTGTLTGSTWTWKMSTLPTIGLIPGLNANTDVNSASISCPSTTTCVTAGQYYDSTGKFNAFANVGTFSAGSWTWSATTLPTGALTPASATATYITPASISCSSTATCVTAGSYIDTASEYDGFLSIGNVVAGTWVWSTSSVPTSGLSPASKPASFTGDFTAVVSCPSPARCVGTGSYSDASSHYDAYSTSLVLLGAASSPSITNLPSSATVGDQFSANVSTTGDGALSLASKTPGVCTVAGLVVNVVGTGTCTLVASVGDGTSYAGATGSSQSFAVSAMVTTTTIPIGTHATQSKLFVSSKKVAVALRAVVTLTTSGGSGSGKVTFRLLRGRCVLTTNHLRARSASACTVVATKAGNTRFKSRSSGATTFYFGFKPQSALVLKVSSHSAKHSSRVTLSTSGGSGHGAVSYAVTGSRCTVSHSTLRASGAASCVVTATKASSATFLPATSTSAVVKFF